ncbi:MAG: protein kinase [Gemmatirosa sp.]|nr:protein kinase [Gemmatirosa sp.]
MSADRDALTAPPGGEPPGADAGADGDADGAAPDPFRAALATALAPTFVLGGELPGGGMSRVFVAEEQALGRTVVVKVLPPDWAPGMNRDRFTREIQLAARLQHPHIVPLLAAGEAAGSLYYTMPFIEGESLRVALARGRRFSVREVVRILHDVVEALAYAHARGVIHRDVKPGNVLMLGNHALVTDFGVAKALSAARQSSGGGMFAPGTTSTGLAIGTPAYMAPEQLAADPAADHRLDIYAAGLLAYELLVGESPFRADSPQATLAAQLTRMPTPLHQVRPDVPEALSAIIERCLAKEPAQRPPTADALLAELEPITYLASGSGAVPGDGSGTLGPGYATPPGTAPLTAPLPAAAAETVGLRAGPVAPRRRPTAMLGGALLGMGIILLGGWAVVRGFGGRAAGVPTPPTAPAAPAPVPLPGTPATAAPAAGPALAVAPRLSRDDSLAIAAAVERRLAAEERSRRQKTAPPMAANEADSIRADAWQHYADSVRESVVRMTRGMGNVAAMPQFRRLGDLRNAPDSATIAALAAAGAAIGANAANAIGSRYGGYRPRTEKPGERPELPERQEAPERPEVHVGVSFGPPPADARAGALAKFGERMPAPKPGVRRVLVLDLQETIPNHPELKGVAGSVGDAVRRSIAARGGYEAVDAGPVRDLARAGVPEAALAAVVHAGAIVTGTIYVQRDSQVTAVILVHDAVRGVPRSLRLPRVSPDLAVRVLGQTAGTEVFGALDRVKWDAGMPPAPGSPKTP